MIEPPLTTIDLRLDDLAQAMTSMLFDLLDLARCPGSPRGTDRAGLDRAKNPHREERFMFPTGFV